jgi:hypothetical protein
VVGEPAVRQRAVEGWHPRASGSHTVTNLLPVREALTEIEPEALKAYIKKAVLEGRDVWAITSLLDRVYAADAAPVAEPHTFDELAS